MAGTLAATDLWPLIQPPALVGLIAALGTKFSQPSEVPSDDHGADALGGCSSMGVVHSQQLSLGSPAFQSCSTDPSLYSAYNRSEQEVKSEVSRHEKEAGCPAGLLTSTQSEQISQGLEVALSLFNLHPDTAWPRNADEASCCNRLQKAAKAADLSSDSSSVAKAEVVSQPESEEILSPVEQQGLENKLQAEAEVVKDAEGTMHEKQDGEAEEQDDDEEDQDWAEKVRTVQSSWRALHKEIEIQVLVWKDCARARHVFHSERAFPATQSALQRTLVDALEQARSINVEDKMAVLDVARLLIRALQQDVEEGGVLTNATRTAAAAAVESVAAMVGPPAAHSLRLPDLPGPVSLGRRQEHPAEQPAARSEATPATRSSASAASGSGTRKTCDKCDGPHATDACPHFRKPREKHKDAWVNYGRQGPKQIGGGGGNFVLRNAHVVRQPGDGSCLFHSLCFGLNGGRSGGAMYAGELRRELMRFIERNPQLEIAGDTFEEWVRWDANCSVSSYCRRMSYSGWGGGIEMAACSLLKKVNVHVYEKRWLAGYKRISCFDCPEKNSRTIHVLYQGAMHYDALLPS